MTVRLREFSSKAANDEKAIPPLEWVQARYPGTPIHYASSYKNVELSMYLIGDEFLIQKHFCAMRGCKASTQARYKQYPKYQYAWNVIARYIRRFNSGYLSTRLTRDKDLTYINSLINRVQPWLYIRSKDCILNYFVATRDTFVHVENGEIKKHYICPDSQPTFDAILKAYNALERVA